MNVGRRLQQHGYSPAAALALLAIAAALFPTEVGGHGGSDSVRAVFAVFAACVAVSVVPFAVSTTETPLDPRLLAAATASAGAAAIHFAVISDHFDEYWLFGVFFIASGAAQLGWAIAVVLRPLTPLVALVGAVGNSAILVLWIVSRTAGLPFGPDAGQAETFGIADGVASTLEVLVVLSTVWYLGRPRQGYRRSRWLAPVVTIVVVALVALALSGPGSHTTHHHQGIGPSLV